MGTTYVSSCLVLGVNPPIGKRGGECPGLACHSQRVHVIYLVWRPTEYPVAFLDRSMFHYFHLSLLGHLSCAIRGDRMKGGSIRPPLTSRRLLTQVASPSDSVGYRRFSGSRFLDSIGHTEVYLVTVSISWRELASNVSHPISIPVLPGPDNQRNPVGGMFFPRCV